MRRVARVLWALHVILQEVCFPSVSFSMPTSYPSAGGPHVAIMKSNYRLWQAATSSPCSRHEHGEDKQDVPLHINCLASLLQLATACILASCIACEDATRPCIWNQAGFRAARRPSSIRQVQKQQLGILVELH